MKSKDTERLDWFEKHSHDESGNECIPNIGGKFQIWRSEKWIDAKSLRQAIDAAMQAERKGKRK